MSALSGLSSRCFPARLILTALLLPLLAGGCAPLVRGEQPAGPERTLLTSSESLGQTFLARYAGMSGVEIYLEPEASGDGQLLLRLRSGAQPGNELAWAELPLSEIDEPGFFRFRLPTQPGSARQDYFASLELQGNGSAWAGSAPGEAYLNGALYRDQVPQDAQLAFRLVYDPWEAARGLLGEGLGWLGRLAAAGLLFVIPGWALLNRLLPGWKGLVWGEKFGLAVGASLSLYPLLFLWTHLAGLQLGPLYAWGPGLTGLGMLILPAFRAARKERAGAGRFFRQIPARLKQVSAPDLAWIALAALIFASRFWVIRGLDAPLWGDSYQHTLITQLLIDRGGLFKDWAPYAELGTFTYHFGFHTLAAVFHWITGLPVPQAVLWTGQILNGLAVLALYPLAVRFGRERWAGVIAILAAGLLVQMPMYYVNWGRYTELGGLAILPAAIYLVDRLLSRSTVEVEPVDVRDDLNRSEENAPGKRESRTGRDRKPWLRFARSDLFKNLLLVWISLAGLALTHYRVLVFAVLFLPLALLFLLQPGRARLALLKTLAAGTGAGLLFLPWFIRLFSGRILRVFGGLVTTPPAQVAESVARYNVIGSLETYMPLAIWLLALLALLWGIWRRERAAALLGLWWFLILLAANPHWLGLPGQGALSNFAVFIAAYLPVAVLTGAAFGWAWNEGLRFTRKLAPDRMNGRGPAGRSSRAENSPGRGNPPKRGRSVVPPTRSMDAARVQLASGWLALLLCLAIGLWGARERLRDVAIAQHALVTRPDLRAADWIQANTPQTSRFLVNSFLAYGDTLVAGSDAGWWLPLLAGRATTLPPINYSSEQGPRPDYLDWTNALTVAIQERGLEDAQVRALLKERGVTHVYIGQQGGRVGNPGPPLLQAGLLSESPYYRVVYHQDRVWIFEMSE